MVSLRNPPHIPCHGSNAWEDYADSHKSKRYQPFAASMAAMYARDLLAVVPQARTADPDLKKMKALVRRVSRGSSMLAKTTESAPIEEGSVDLSVHFVQFL